MNVSLIERFLPSDLWIQNGGNSNFEVVKKVKENNVL